MPGFKPRLKIVAVAACVALALAACGGNKKDKTRLSGERISVMALEQKLAVDPVTADIQVHLPEPVVNLEWPQAGGYPNHAMYHLALDDSLSEVWHRKIAVGTHGNRRLMATPVVGNGTLFVLDADENVVAVDAETGKARWKISLGRGDEKRDSGFGGGIAYHQGRVFATTGFGYIVALDANDGRELWRQTAGVPFRGAPTVADGQVYAVTHDNQLYAYNEENGTYLWYHVGIAEDAGILGAASPAVQGQTVLAAYSSGELFAIRTANGGVAWQDALSRTGRLTPLSSINDIDGEPVIADDHVYAVSHGDRMVSIDLRTGARDWERNVSSIHTPWIAGDFIFLVTMDGDLVALYRPDGKVRWILPLQKYVNVEDAKHLISWSGPILAGNRLIVVSSHGYVVSVSPYTGQIISASRAADSLNIEPIVANKTLYVMDDGGTVYALR
jgi:outer membrane protein assembly factor BamB